MIDCVGCDNFYYGSGGDGACDAPYENACHRANHIFYSDPTKFVEEYLDIKLYPWQKLMLRWAFKKEKKNIIWSRKLNVKIDNGLQKLFLKTSFRAHWHKKHKVRVKNSKRAQKILGKLFGFRYKKWKEIRKKI